MGHANTRRLRRQILRLVEAAIKPNPDMDGSTLEKVPESQESIGFDEP
jgi:hypothetical protein